jgi:hypothetical protein
MVKKDIKEKMLYDLGYFETYGISLHSIAVSHANKMDDGEILVQDLVMIKQAELLRSVAELLVIHSENLKALKHDQEKLEKSLDQEDLETLMMCIAYLKVYRSKKSA